MIKFKQHLMLFTYYLQLFPTIIVNLAALSSGMGYGFSAIALPQLKEVTKNAFSQSDSARSYYQPFTVDEDGGSWIGMCYASHCSFSLIFF
jgi:hypothetical protein